ncbi:putative conserved carboxylase domain [Prochlorococcus sp. MIT 0602]|nr:putative conserved carboxylase domain [Prochlorococcus sp. MIT 0602]KGG15927.1 putative conserved carboxylase domain [Prochlorococcus sp. MIT 0603]
MPPRRPLGNGASMDPRQGPRPTFLTLRDHGKVYVADLPNLSDGQLAHIAKEAEEVLTSLERRITDLEGDITNKDNDTLIKASTKHDVTLRFIRAIEGEQDHRRNNPALKDAATESLPRTFLEVARHRLPGATFDSLLREALEACAKEEDAKNSPPPEVVKDTSPPLKIVDLPSSNSTSSVLITD